VDKTDPDADGKPTCADPCPHDPQDKCALNPKNNLVSGGGCACNSTTSVPFSPLLWLLLLGLDVVRRRWCPRRDSMRR
jgi:hypothetical protein